MLLNIGLLFLVHKICPTLQPFLLIFDTYYRTGTANIIWDFSFLVESGRIEVESIIAINIANHSLQKTFHIVFCFRVYFITVLAETLYTKSSLRFIGDPAYSFLK